LEERGGEYIEEVRKKLAQRGQAEADDMREILERQRDQIQKTRAKYDDPQMCIDFDTDEQRQLQSNQRHWEKRLAALEHELRTEPGRIRALYEVKAQRIEPVGLVYLWPVTG
jgi:predicted  nucleic acid-binding Zn-ribbon protein